MRDTSRERYTNDVIQFAVGEFEKQLRERMKSVHHDVEGRRQRREVLRVEIQLDQIEKLAREGFADVRQLSSKNAIAAKAELGKHCPTLGPLG